MICFNGEIVVSNEVKEVDYPVAWWLILKVSLESEVFWYHICNTSKPYLNEHKAFAKNYMVNFAILELSENIHFGLTYL